MERDSVTPPVGGVECSVRKPSEPAGGIERLAKPWRRLDHDHDVDVQLGQLSRRGGELNVAEVDVGNRQAQRGSGLYPAGTSSGRAERRSSTKW